MISRVVPSASRGERLHIAVACAASTPRQSDKPITHQLPGKRNTAAPALRSNITLQTNGSERDNHQVTAINATASTASACRESQSTEPDPDTIVITGCVVTRR